MVDAARQVVTSRFAERLRCNIVPIEVVKARRDFKAFAEYCFEDDDGDPIKQASHHDILHSLIHSHNRLIVWFPVEHGKTTQVIFNILWLLAHNPTHSYSVVGATAKQAYKIVGAVKRQIDRNDRLRQVFPRLRPMLMHDSIAREQWGTTALRIEGGGRGADKDPSLAGYGLDGDISGSRLDGVFMDNMLDGSNTMSKTLREKTITRVDNDILTRVRKQGFACMTDTAWLEDDALHVISKRSGWYSEKFDAERNGKAGATLWPSQFSVERLRFLQTTMTKGAYKRMYRSIPLAAGVGRFTTALITSARTGKWMDRYTGMNPICTGVDLSTGEGEDRTVFATMELLGDRYRLINVQADYWEGPDIVRRAIDIFNNFHKGNHRKGVPARFRVESNGQQKYIKQMMSSADIMRALDADTETVRKIIVDNHTTTGFNKQHYQYGIPSLADDMEMKRLILPVEDRDEVQTLIDELRNWTPDQKHHTGDSVIATWIAKTGLESTTPTVVVI